MGVNIPEPPTYPLMPNMEDCLHIVFDKHNGEQTLMMVVRIKNKEQHIINLFKGKEAEDLYKKLVDWDNQI